MTRDRFEVDNTAIDAEQEKIFIVQPGDGKEASALEREAVSLVESAGAVHAGTMFLPVRAVNPATYIGSGKLQELQARLAGLDIAVLFNGELTPSQTLNVSAALDGRKVIDRTALILDIFARHARSSEGKLQVELAQLQYMYPRLKGKGEGLSRLGGGIGTRGPGETKLETDRRRIRTRIRYLEERLADVKSRRKLFDERRKKSAANTVSLLGYTNTGKSTLLNALTDAGVLAEDKLFATLDPTTRKLTVDGSDFLLTDTVGFLRQLPHDLISAFHSTLESALQCGLALIVCDATDDYAMQLETTLSLLQELGGNVPYRIVVNKCENLQSFDGFPAGSLFVSAKYGLGLDRLKAEIVQFFRSGYERILLHVPYGKMGEYERIRRFCSEWKREYGEDGVEIGAEVSAQNLPKFLPFRTSPRGVPAN